MGVGVEKVEILVAEDNEVNRIVIEQILELSGHSFRIARDGAEAVALFPRLKPALVLMDVSMPRMNGFEATAAIRRLEAGTGEEVPIIGLTAHALRGDRERCLDAGMNDYISKPLSPDRVLEKVEAWLGAAEAQRRSA